MHRSWSSHSVPSALVGVEHRPVEVLQVPATWHWSSAGQSASLVQAHWLVVGTHTPAWQASPLVHGLPSSQVWPVAAAWLISALPVAPILHLSVVQSLPSSMVASGLASHLPALQVPWASKQASAVAHGAPALAVQSGTGVRNAGWMASRGSTSITAPELAGAAGSVIDVFHDPRLPTRIPIEAGVLAVESAEMLRAFFADRRGG